MDFLNKTKQSLKNAGSSISQKASDMSGTVTFSMKIKEGQKKLENSYAELGKAMMTEHVEEVKKLCPEWYANYCEIQKQLEADKKELIAKKGLQICPNCGSEQSKDVIHCTVCGMSIQEAAVIMESSQPAPQPQPQPQPVAPAAAANTCKNCGETLPAGVVFCPSCGTKVE